MLTDSGSTTETIIVDDLNAAIDHHTNQLAYRLDVIFPADAPREAVLSEPPAVAGGSSSDTTISNRPQTIRLKLAETHDQPHATAGSSDWIVGRAGMEYRDLVPGRLGGRLIASHIRLSAGGPVPDYVHYHKVEFQMIYCHRGRVKVVYEDQGPPFWLEPGDCVLQPPEIRHRVLEAAAGTEVIEIGVPAVHETWVEHEIDLPTGELNPNREFGGQRFVRHIAGEAAWIGSGDDGFVFRDTGIASATDGFADVRIIRSNGLTGRPFLTNYDRELELVVSLEGGLTVRINGTKNHLDEVEAFPIADRAELTINGENGSFLLIKIGSKQS